MKTNTSMINPFGLSRAMNDITDRIIRMILKG